MEERRKHKSSIITKDLESADVSQANDDFDPIARYLTGGPVPLSEVVCISRVKNLYCTKAADDISRKKLLDNGHSLKDSDFRRVYRDLTYMQRHELWNRRSGTLAHTPESAGPVENQSELHNHPSATQPIITTHLNL